MAQQIQPKVSQTQQSTALVQQPVKATCCGPTCTDTTRRTNFYLEKMVVLVNYCSCINWNWLWNLFFIEVIQ